MIKIGVMTDMSGLYADIDGPGSVIAAKMAVEDFGAAGKGMKVEIVSRRPPEQARRRLDASRASGIDTDKVDVIVDVPTSSVALAVNQIAKEKKKAFLDSGAATSDLTSKDCSPNTVHWTYDTWMLANGTGSAMVKTGGNTWFFLTADYAFGHALERDTDAVVTKAGGKVLGTVRHPLNAHGLLVVPAAGAGVEGEDHRPGQRRRRHHQLDQAGGRVRHRQGRAEPGRPAGVHHRRPRAWA